MAIIYKKEGKLKRDRSAFQAGNAYKWPSPENLEATEKCSLNKKSGGKQLNLKQFFVVVRASLTSSWPHQQDLHTGRKNSYGKRRFKTDKQNQQQNK